MRGKQDEALRKFSPVNVRIQSALFVSWAVSHLSTKGAHRGCTKWKVLKEERWGQEAVRTGLLLGVHLLGGRKRQRFLSCRLPLSMARMERDCVHYLSGVDQQFLCC